MLVFQSKERETAWEKAAQGLRVNMTKEQRVCAEDAPLNTDDLKNKCLVAKERCGYTAWHRAIDKRNFEELGTIWSWDKEAEINPEELLLAKNNRGITAWNMAAGKII